MNIVSIIMAVFAVIAAIDLMIGNKLGLGKEFEKGINMLGNLVLSMLGMIVLAPLFVNLLSTPLEAISNVIPVSPSAFIGSILANDMGGAPICESMTNGSDVGYFSGLIIGSTMGATVSFTLPFVMGAVDKAQRKNMLLGLLCGICTIPVECLIGGLISGLNIVTILINLSPLILLSGILALGLLVFPKISVKIFNILGIVIRVIVIGGLAIGIFEYLTGLDIIPYTAPVVTLEGVTTIFNIACVMAGAFPLLHIVSTVLKKPLKALSRKIGMNETGTIGFISTLATSVTTFGMMKDMDDKSVVLNSAFAVSAAFTLADHLAYTLSFKAEYLPAVTAGKLISGILAVALAAIIYKKSSSGEKKLVK